ncbi:MAG: type II secretion system F family protein [Gammaproteobacteria bacterium]|nr:type II secretion system F family protein [Gammaproteobacteria bacterium]
MRTWKDAVSTWLNCAVRFPRARREVFYRLVAAQLRGGVAVRRALDTLGASARLDAVSTGVARTVGAAVEEGQLVADGFVATRSVPRAEIGLIRVAERSGTMVEALEELGRSDAKRLTIARNVLAPNSYYLIALVMAVLGTMQVEDMLAAVLGHDALAANGAYALSRRLNEWMPPGTVALATVAAAIVAGRGHWHGRARRLLGFFDAEHRARLALQFAEFAARLYNRGATHAEVLDAFDEAYARSGFVRWAVREARRDHIDAGMSIEDALAGRLVPEWLAGVLSAMVPGGRRDLYPGAWDALGTMQRSLLETRLRTASALLRGAAIGTIGMLVAVVVPGIYTAYTVPI